MFLDIYLSPHYQRRLLVLTLNSDHFHSRQKPGDIIDHGLAQQQQQPGRGGGLGPTDANMRIAGGGREKCGHWCGQAAVTLPNYRKMFSSVPPPPAAASSRQPAVRCGPVWPLSCLSFCSLTLCRCCLSACHPCHLLRTFIVQIFKVHKNDYILYLSIFLTLCR